MSALDALVAAAMGEHVAHTELETARLMSQKAHLEVIERVHTRLSASECAVVCNDDVNKAFFVSHCPSSTGGVHACVGASAPWEGGRGAV